MLPVKPLALQLYSVREALAVDWRTTLSQIADIGFLGVETAGFSYAPAADVKQMCDELGLQIIAAHMPLPLGNQQQAVLETAAILNCERIICASIDRNRLGSMADIRALADQYNAASQVAQQHGLQFGLHNHNWEFARVNGRLAFDILRDALDEAIFFEVDTYWVATTGVDVQALIAGLGRRAQLLHIKDGPLAAEAPMVAIGSGKMNFQQLIPAATAAEWLVVELDWCATEMVTAVADSYRFLTQNGLARGRK